ncbi:MAG: hypothetical protein DWI28_06170 [Planctomycetota bacterium]|nr:MAG: hypothetical protein DWI28_06170 [Planctomycetota bacterium]
MWDRKPKLFVTSKARIAFAGENSFKWVVQPENESVGKNIWRRICEAIIGSDIFARKRRWLENKESPGDQNRPPGLRGI